jgi:hypothetical protein
MGQDDPFYAPSHRPMPRTPQPGELLEFGHDHSTWSCELRDDGKYGVEAHIRCEGELVISRRFADRALATQWAEHQRNAIEKGVVR